MQPRSFGDVKQVPERAGETIVGSLARRNRPVYVLSLCSVTFSGSVESFNMAPCYVSPWYRVLTSPRGFAHGWLRAADGHGDFYSVEVPGILNRRGRRKR